MGRVILHGDLNNFYASVECLLRPELKGQPVAVGGNEERRHGIVLAKNYLAKSFGIKTGETLWQARRKCPALIVVPPRFDLYLLFSAKVRKIFDSYTNFVEPFGLDEAWLDISGKKIDLEKGRQIADNLRFKTRQELGITLSVGVSYNKIFAKLGSDYKKPDATTVISRENYRSLVWNLPVRSLLFVGAATEARLAELGILTIGALARTPKELLVSLLGKNGETLWCFANGEDNTPVAESLSQRQIKSIGNSITTPRDLKTPEDVRIIFYVLAESVASRLRGANLSCNGVQIQIRDKLLYSFERQAKLNRPSCSSGVLAKKALDLFNKSYQWRQPLRSLGLRAIDLETPQDCRQLSLFDDIALREKEENLNRVLDDLRRRFGYNCIGRAIVYEDKDLAGLNPKEEHIIYPKPFA